ncbi:MAG TPA: ATP-binding protein [Devosiaceae bacterium]|jgi:hypothetical protein
MPDQIAQEPKPKLAERIADSAISGIAVTGSLKTDDRIIARVTDGIYQEPWSAFRELISNAYDADATEVSIDCDYPFFKEIRITDNGHGMNRQTVADLLEHIGGSSKRTARGKQLGTVMDSDPTRSRGGRKLIGKIGIGLFAVAQLTQHFQIISKRKGESERVSATILLDTYRENAQTEEDETDYSGGTYSVVSENVPDLDAHGTTIILMAIRPAIRKKLQSAEIWTAIEDQQDDPDTGILDLIVPPLYHIGRLDDNGALATDANLPWGDETDPLKRFTKLYTAAVETDRGTKEQANLAHFDNYLKMIWRLGLASPVKYLAADPFSVTGTASTAVYSIANSKKGASTSLTLGDHETVAERLGVRSEVSDNFQIFIDGTELRRPIVLPDSLNAHSAISHPLLFVGKVETSFTSAAVRRSGGDLRFDAYLYWNSKIIPKESVGALIRVNGASGTLFDPEFLTYQVSEQTRKKQITCEIFVHTGLDGALNIDRESFNTSHPHYLYIQQWLHSAFRQFANEHKRLGRIVTIGRKIAREKEYETQVESFTEQVWQKVRGTEYTAPEISRTPQTDGSQNMQVGATSVHLSAERVSGDLPFRSNLINAVSLILEAYGLLERLDDDSRGELIFDLISLLEKNS